MFFIHLEILDPKLRSKNPYHLVFPAAIKQPISALSENRPTSSLPPQSHSSLSSHEQQFQLKREVDLTSTQASVVRHTEATTEKPHQSHDAVSVNLASAQTNQDQTKLVPQKNPIDIHRAIPLESNIQPAYPESAKRRKNQGTVTVSVAVNTKGELSQLQILKSSGISALDQSVLKTVIHWRFKAAQHNGLAIEDLITLSFDFYLNP